MKVTIAGSASIGFFCSYFMELTMANAEQYLAVAAVLLLDGFFGIIAGVKREGFKTYKALKVLKSLATWEIILTAILMIEKGFAGNSQGEQPPEGGGKGGEDEEFQKDLKDEKMTFKDVFKKHFSSYKE